MKGMDGLRGHLVRKYREKNGKSRRSSSGPGRVMIGGGSHTIRL